MTSNTTAVLEEQITQLKDQLIEAENLLQLLQAGGRRPVADLIRLDEAHLRHNCAAEDFNPEVLKAHGWEDALTSLVKPNPYLAILRATDSAPGRIEVLVLFPTASSTPIHIDVRDCASVSAL